MHSYSKDHVTSFFYAWEMDHPSLAFVTVVGICWKLNLFFSLRPPNTLACFPLQGKVLKMKAKQWKHRITFLKKRPSSYTEKKIILDFMVKRVSETVCTECWRRFIFPPGSWNLKKLVWFWLSGSVVHAPDATLSKDCLSTELSAHI